MRQRAGVEEMRQRAGVGSGSGFSEMCSLGVGAKTDLVGQASTKVVVRIDLTLQRRGRHARAHVDQVVRRRLVLRQVERAVQAEGCARQQEAQERNEQGEPHAARSCRGDGQKVPGIVGSHRVGQGRNAVEVEQSIAERDRAVGCDGLVGCQVERARVKRLKLCAPTPARSLLGREGQRQGARLARTSLTLARASLQSSSRYLALRE